MIKNLHIFNIAMEIIYVNNYEWIKDTSLFNGHSIKSYNEESDKGYFLDVHVQCLEKLHKLHNDLLFLPERMKIEKVKKLVAKSRDKIEYVIHAINLKQTSNHELVTKK